MPFIATTRQRFASLAVSILPPLQKGLWNRELDRVFGELQEEVEGRATGQPRTTPRPSSTPLPKPGLTPEIDADHLKQDFRNIDRSRLSGNSKILFDLTMEQLRTNQISSNVYSSISANYTKLLNESNKIKLLDKVKDDSASQATWDESIINNQTAYSSKVGSFGRNGNLAENGCGFMAIHNANQILGISSRFDETYYELNKAGDLATNWSGKLGMNPLVIGGYYRQHGAEVTLYTNPANVPTDCDSYIALFFYSDGGAHYVAAKYNQTTQKFDVYNLLADGEKKQMDSLSASDYPGMKKTEHWIIWGIDSPVNTNDSYSSSPIEKENQGSRRDL